MYSDKEDTQARLANNPWLGRHFFEVMVGLAVIFAIGAVCVSIFDNGF